MVHAERADGIPAELYPCHLGGRGSFSGDAAAAVVPKRGDRLIYEPHRYIRKTARSVVIDWHRQRRARVDPISVDSLEELEPTDSHENPFDEVARDQEWAIIHQIVKLLPPRCREVFVLCRIEGHAYATVAARLNITVGTVKSHLQDASFTITRELGELRTVMNRGSDDRA